MSMEVVGGALLSSFLSVLFDRLASRPVVDFIRGQKITSGLLKKLRIKLLSVNSVLDDAEEKQFNNPAVREWLDELKDALYAADDLLDEIKTEALRRKLEGDESESSSRKSQVRISSSTWIDEFDKTMEPKIVEMLGRLEFIVNEKDVLGLNDGVPNRRPQSRLSATSLVEEDGVYGRDEDKEAIVKLLLSDDANGNKLSVIPVVGMGGVGNTTLVQLVYNDARVKQHFDLQAWVYVSSKTRHFSYTQNSPFLEGLGVGVHATAKEEISGFDKFEALCEAKYLRTFLAIKPGPLWNIFCFNKVPHDLLRTLYCLRVLSLSHCNNKELPYWIGNLKHLRYIDLSYSRFEKLPETICTLHNLQTLLLFNCDELAQLPINLGRLINLRHLDVRSTNLKEMPPHMDKLKDLHTLSDFVVGKQAAPSIVVLKELQLVGTLAISGLHNIVNSEDAFVANMRNKHLDGLALTWGAETDDSQKDREVLNNLQPHTHLKALSLKFYGGTRFPDWLGDHSFSNLVSLQLEDCKHCCSLPPLGQLSSLVTLYVCGLNEVETIGPEFYGNIVMPFRSLSVLFFRDMLGWQEWSHFGSSQEGGAFPHLCQLYLTNCPKLTEKLPEYLPSLTTLEIRRCEQLLGSLPRTGAILEVPYVKDNLCLEEKTSGTNSSLTPFPCDGLADALRVFKIKNCWNLSPLNHRYAFLETLKIKSSCDSTKSIPLDYFPKVKELKLYDCRNLESLTCSQDSESPTILSLSSLRIFNCPNFVSFPDGGLYAPNLIVLNISECDKLRSLPEHMCTSLSSLQAVILEYCSELESFPEGGLPSNLDMLRIFGSKKLIANRMHWGLDRLICLRYLAFSFDECEDVVSFPEEGLLPTILTTLCIFNSPNLKILDSKGFQNLTALQHLFIDECNELECLPEGLPTSLSHLDINKCPLLTQRCQKEIGEDWLKISHITRVTVDGLDFIN